VKFYKDLTKNDKIIIISDPILTKGLITFDDLPDASEACKVISGIYRGLKWTGVSYVHKSYLKGNLLKSGYATSFIPDGSPHVAYFKNEASITTEHTNETFTLLSVNACASWFDHLQLTIRGYRNSTEINGHTSTLLFGKPQIILLDWKDIDRIIFKTFGGTIHPGSGGTADGTQVVITQLKLSYFG
jgi:hypothetical protein